MIGARVWSIVVRMVRPDGSLVAADVYSADGWRVWSAVIGRGDESARWDHGAARIPLRERRRAERMMRRAMREASR